MSIEAGTDPGLADEPLPGSSARKSFVLGLGMAKAGTTWLFDYLQAHPEVQMGFEKEMHILHVPEFGHLLGALRHMPWRKFGGTFWLRQQVIRAWYRTDWNRYFSYFSSLLAHGKIATGDLSPSNQRMSVQSMARVRDEFLARGIRVVAIFIVRDPVERVFSDVKYSERILARSRYRSPTGKPYEELFRERIALPRAVEELESETDRRMRSVFEAGDRMLLLHEELFEQATIDGLAAKIGLSRIPASTSRKVNAAPDAAVLSEALRREAAGVFADIYHWAAGQFGHDRILRSWPNAKYVLGAASQ
jgi:hypothetical protein